MSAALKILPNYTYNDYVHWEGKWELIDGFPIAMSPAPLPKHQRATMALGAEFVFALKKCKKCKVYGPIDFKINESTILQPDISIICGKPTKAYLDFPPVLVVEVLSPATALRDRHTKYGIYEEQGIKYYLIVDVDKTKVEVYVLVNGKYELQEYDTNKPFFFSFEEDCNADILFSEIWENLD
jgi:Uma2 family endonuclease